MAIADFARALRCRSCGHKGGKSLLGTFPQTPRKPLALIDRRKPQKRLDFIGLAFRIAERENRERMTALGLEVPPQFSDTERARYQLARAMLGWSNE